MQDDGGQESFPSGNKDMGFIFDHMLSLDGVTEDDPEYHKADLPTACARGHVKRVQTLLDQGADVNKYWHVSVK